MLNCLLLNFQFLQDGPYILLKFQIQTNVQFSMPNFINWSLQIFKNDKLVSIFHISNLPNFFL